MNIFRLLTPITYWVLVGLWTFKLVFCLRRLRSPKIESRQETVGLALNSVGACDPEESLREYKERFRTIQGLEEAAEVKGGVPNE